METNKVVPCIPLFGILTSVEAAEWLNEEECHYCLEAVQNNDVYILTTPCCRHLVHCSCFKKWIKNHSSCSYCRAEMKIRNFYLLCLHEATEDEQVRKTVCCGALVHRIFLENLKGLLSQLPHMTGYRCRHVDNCKLVILNLQKDTVNNS